MLVRGGIPYRAQEPDHTHEQAALDEGLPRATWAEEEKEHRHSQEDEQHGCDVGCVLPHCQPCSITGTTASESSGALHPACIDTCGVRTERVIRLACQ